jgi:predicted  nucleic acid-binding Zn-ribbon protein
MVMTKTLGRFFWLLLLVGCATTTDPRQGGLFSYNPQAYEQRLEERRQTMAALDKKRLEAERLEREVKAKRETLAEQKKLLSGLDAELAVAQQRIATYQSQNQQQANEKGRLERHIRQAKTRLQALQKESSDSPQEAQAKQAQIQQLRTDIEKLSQVVNLLLQSAQ